MKGIRHSAILAVLLLSIGVTACEEAGQPGPMQRTGAYIDRTVTDAQRGVADFSLRAGQSLDQAGRSVGAGAQRVGASLHDSLTPAADRSTPPAGWNGQQSVTTTGDYSSGSLPKPTPMNP